MQKIGDVAKLSVWLVTFLLALPLAQAEVNVQATVDRNQINQGEVLVLTVAVSSDQGFNLGDPRLSEINGFQLINSWTGSESRSTFANGRFETVRTQKFNYQLVAQTVGQFTVGPVQLAVNGQSYQTKPIVIKVLAAGAQPSRRGGTQAQPSSPLDPLANDPFPPAGDIDDLFNQLLGGRRQAVQPEEAKDLVSIKVNVDKTEVYAGEQITTNWSLYTRGQIRDIDTLKYPSLSSFWKEDIEIATHLNFTNEVINGVVHKRALLTSYALFPIKEGDAVIDPYRAKITVFGSGGAFGFGAPPTTVTKESRPIKIKVKPLPTVGRPDNFTGAVGDFTINSSVEGKEVKLNQPFTLKIRFDGEGNAKLIDLPKLSWPAGLELYDTKKEAKFFKTGKSYREFELLLIPRQEGPLEIPPFSLSVFDPKSGTYVSKALPAISLNVLPGDPSQAPVPSLTTSAPAQPSQGPQLPQVAVTWSSSSWLEVFNRLTTWMVVWLFLLVALGLKARKEFGGSKQKASLMRAVSLRFAKVHRLVAQGDWRAVGVEGTNAIYQALGGIAGEGGANVEVAKLLLKFPPSVRQEVGAQIEKEIEAFQTLSFAPEAMVGVLKEKKELAALVQRAEALIKKAIAMSEDGVREK